MKITRQESNDCGGFRPPKGHLDTQMFPECAGKETDRNIVKKTVERRKKGKVKTRAGQSGKVIIVAAHSWPIESEGNKVGLWQGWMDKKIDDRKFVLLMKSLVEIGWTGVTKDPTVRNGIATAIRKGLETGDFKDAAARISSWLSHGKRGHEQFVEGSKEEKDMKIGKIEVDAKKKKKWNPNFWAVCTKSVGREDKDKYERCVMHVKEKQAFNLREYITANKK